MVVLATIFKPLKMGGCVQETTYHLIHIYINKTRSRSKMAKMNVAALPTVLAELIQVYSWNGSTEYCYNANRCHLIQLR